MDKPKLTHEQLCERARRWLRGSRRCDPVFSNLASCGEIPDAIGWSSCWKWHGSTVVECKTSRSDFYADQKKKFDYRHREHGWRYSRISKREAESAGFVQVPLTMMGDYRYYLSEPDVLTRELVEKHAPDHGLLLLVKGRIVVVREAPKRTELIDKDGEIRYLRFAIINRKTPYDHSGPENVVSELVL